MFAKAKKHFAGFSEGIPEELAALDARLHVAHAAADKAGLVALYSEAANAARDVDGECFFLTHAYIHALELGDPRASGLRARLLARGREE